MNVNVDGIKTVSHDDKIIYEVNCYVTGLEQLNKLMLSLSKNSYVENVERLYR